MKRTYNVVFSGQKKLVTYSAKYLHDTRTSLTMMCSGWWCLLYWVGPQLLVWELALLIPSTSAISSARRVGEEGSSKMLSILCSGERDGGRERVAFFHCVNASIHTLQLLHMLSLVSNLHWLESVYSNVTLTSGQRRCFFFFANCLSGRGLQGWLHLHFICCITFPTIDNTTEVNGRGLPYWMSVPSPASTWQSKVNEHANHN